MLKFCLIEEDRCILDDDWILDCCGLDVAGVIVRVATQESLTAAECRTVRIMEGTPVELSVTVVLIMNTVAPLLLVVDMSSIFSVDVQL